MSPRPLVGWFFCLLIGLTLCSTPAGASTGSDAAKDPLATRRAELEQRAQQAYDQIIAAQTEPLATTADEVIERCIEGMGGLEALTSLRTLTMKSNGYMVSRPFGSTRHLKAPNHIWQERSGGRAVVTDGISAWQIENGQWQALPASNVMWQQVYSITLDLVDYEAKNVTYEFMGTEALEGGAFYKLRKTTSTGKVFFIYFDIETGLLTMEEEFGDRGWRANLFYDHRPEGGVMLPHMRVRVAETIKTAHVALLSYEVNPPLKDELFIEP